MSENIILRIAVNNLPNLALLTLFKFIIVICLVSCQTTDDGIETLTIPLQLAGSTEDGEVVVFKTVSRTHSDVIMEVGDFCTNHNIIDQHCARLLSIIEARLDLHPDFIQNESHKPEEFLYLPSLSMGDFATIARKYGTDKYSHHGYHRFYPRFLEPYRSMFREKSGQNQLVQKQQLYGMIEIGVDQYMSLQLWLDYFPDIVFVYGLDIATPPSAGDRYRILQCDQSSVQSLSKQITEHVKHPIFLIVDDGSHNPVHQLLGFDYLFKELLEPGGTYIIEDVEVSYWHKYGDQSFGYLMPKSAIEVLKALVDDVNREFLDPRARAQLDSRLDPFISRDARDAVSTVTFGHNCIIVVKKTAEEYRYFNREYRFREQA